MKDHQDDKKSSQYFACPCCGYPTLSERGGYEICPLCSWEDDGQDEADAHEVWGGPNGNYSLKEAQENFRKYYTMYSPSDKNKFELTTVKKNGLGKIVLDKVALKKDIIKKYQTFQTLDNEAERQKLMEEIMTLEEQL